MTDTRKQIEAVIEYVLDFGVKVKLDSLKGKKYTTYGVKQEATNTLIDIVNDEVVRELESILKTLYLETGKDFAQHIKKRINTLTKKEKQR